MSAEATVAARRPGLRIDRVRNGNSAPLLAIRAAFLLLPSFVLLAGMWRVRGTAVTPTLLGLGAIFQLLVVFFRSVRRDPDHRSLRPAVYLLYLSAWAWTCLLVPSPDWYLDFAQAVLLLVPAGGFAVQMLEESGARQARRARIAAKRLGERKQWPGELDDYADLPEVKEFRESLASDPTPALTLLSNQDVGVRAAALMALEGRRSWQPGQPAFFLRLARHAQEPIVRAAAVAALGNVDDRFIIETLAEFLRDPSRQVRQKALNVLFQRGEERWSWIRHAMRHALADARLQEDGPMLPRGEALPGETIKDLTGWAGEKGILAARAAATLGAHFSRALGQRPDPALLSELRRQLADAHSPAGLRVELAQLLQSHQFLDRPVREKLLDPLNPAPLRLMAADALLAEGQHPGAVTALRDIGRLPNREIGLATAQVVQRRLGVDLGLAASGPLPSLHTRQAAEVTRRVMAWALDGEPAEEANGFGL